MLTCLCDAFYGEAGIAAVEVLEHCGIEVLFPAEQTCCGQPAFNSGDWATARPIIQRTAEVFDPSIPIIAPSASCIAMLRHGSKSLGLDLPHRAFELSEFLLEELGVDRWPLRGGVFWQRKVAFHRSCHGRSLHLEDKQIQLLRTMRGTVVLEPEDADQCCGFGGAFSATHGTISAGVGSEKLRNLRELDVQEIVTGDAGCLMHLANLKSDGEPLRMRHYVQLLAEAIG